MKLKDVSGKRIDGQTWKDTTRKDLEMLRYVRVVELMTVNRISWEKITVSPNLTYLLWQHMAINESHDEINSIFLERRSLMITDKLRTQSLGSMIVYDALQMIIITAVQWIIQISVSARACQQGQ